MIHFKEEMLKFIEPQLAARDALAADVEEK